MWPLVILRISIRATLVLHMDIDIHTYFTVLHARTYLPIICDWLCENLKCLRANFYQILGL